MHIGDHTDTRGARVQSSHWQRQLGSDFDYTSCPAGAPQESTTAPGLVQAGLLGHGSSTAFPSSVTFEAPGHRGRTESYVSGRTFLDKVVEGFKGYFSGR